MSHRHNPKFLPCIPRGHGRSRTRGSRRWLMAWAIVWAVIAVPCPRAQTSRPTDYDVKAVYLYNFGRFVEWPSHLTATKTEPFTICVLGQDPFGSALDATLAGETIAGKSVTTKRISIPQKSDDCQILFVSSAEEPRLVKIMETLDKEAILTVSDMPEFSQRGGMIQFEREGKKVRFEVNLVAVQRAGLALSSELLKVATTVRRNP